MSIYGENIGWRLFKILIVVKLIIFGNFWFCLSVLHQGKQSNADIFVSV